MEKKQNNKSATSINSVIYLLMAVMLAGVVFVSIFTVASRRGGKTTTDTAGQQTESLQSGDASVREPEGDLSESVDTDGTSLTETAATAPETDKSSSVPESDAAKASVGEEEIPAATELRYFVIPVAGTVSKSFEIDIPVYSATMNDYRAHAGVDISAPIGCEVISASSGTVCKVWDDPLMGCAVTVDHGDNIYTTYMNLSEELAPDIAVGGKIAMGQTIGAVGDSALIEISEEPHLHLEMKVDGVYVDPLEYMGVASMQEVIYED